MDDLNYREILVRKPFYEVSPKGYMEKRMAFSSAYDTLDNAPEDYVWRAIKTQADFLREYYPSGHIIFDKERYPDVLKQDPESKKWYVQEITRTAFSFQQVIALKHTLHLTGNDIQFEIADGSQDDKQEEKMQKSLIDFKKGWLMSDMEIRFYEAVRSYMIVAEAAVVGFFNEEGKFGARELSYMNHDTLYPHYDSITGELKLFARRYFDYDEEGVKRTEWVEVWDKTYLYRYNRVADRNKYVERILDVFGMRGYNLVSKEKHGFNFVPVAYVRNDDGPAWHAVQRNIEDYEEAFSYLCENNKAYAFPIMYFKGEGIDIQGDNMTGSVKAIAMTDTDSDAGFLNGTDASDAFATQLNKSYDLIYELSFTVKPPELKSGDLPGVAIKLLYSPALEVAMNDAQKLKPFLNQLVRMAKFGVGYENNCTASMLNLPISAWIKPYTHQNDTELFTNLATAVQNKFLSKQTASERITEYSKNDEYSRIMEEYKETQEMDLLVDIQRQEAQVENNIKEEEAAAKISSGQGGSGGINTGHGQKRGRKNKSGKQWDKNNNNPIDDANNWDNYDKKH